MQYLRGACLSFSSRPSGLTGVELSANVLRDAGVDYREDAVVVLDQGHIKAVHSPAEFQAQGGQLAEVTDVRPGLILPGFVDTHIHYPQMDIVGSFGNQLLDWLDNYAFPAELAFASREHAEQQAQQFVQRLVSSGTTTALTFTTVHPHSTDAVFEAAQQLDMRLIAGKVLMNRNAPPGLLDLDDGATDNARLAEKWHGQGRLSYAITPRFAITCTADQLKAAGELLARHDGLYLHTHVSEHPDEVQATLSLFPEADDYVDVYARFNLLTDRSVFAHGIHLSDQELRTLSAAGSKIAFCPTSNMFLGSGLLDLNRLDDFGVHKGVGTDVGGGTSFSLLTTLAEGYKVNQLNGQSWHPLEAIYAATTGGALALSLDDKIGRVAAGYEADLVVLRPQAGSVLERRVATSGNWVEQLFAYMMLGGSDAIDRTYVAGEIAYQRDHVSTGSV